MSRFDQPAPRPFSLNKDILDSEYSDNTNRLQNMADRPEKSVGRGAAIGGGIGAGLGGAVGGIGFGGGVKQRLLAAALGAAIGGAGGAGIGAADAGLSNSGRTNSQNVLSRIAKDPEYANRHRLEHDDEMNDNYMSDLRDEGAEEEQRRQLMMQMLAESMRSRTEPEQPGQF